MGREIISDRERYEQRKLTFYSFLVKKFDLKENNKFQVVFPNINKKNRFDISKAVKGQEGKFVELPDGSSQFVLGRVHMDTDNVYSLNDKGEVSILYLHALAETRESLKKDSKIVSPPFIFNLVDIDRMDSVRAYYYSNLFD